MVNRDAMAAPATDERSREESTAYERAVRTYQVRTYGCQMNVHDSERLSGLLEDAGYRRAEDGSDADIVVFNTCAVRENADNKLYGNLSHLAPRKNSDPNMQIAVGGCLAQKDRDAVLKKAKDARSNEKGSQETGGTWEEQKKRRNRLKVVRDRRHISCDLGAGGAKRNRGLKPREV